MLKKLDFLLLGIIAILLIVLLYLGCMNGIPSFDGAMNLQVPVNLVTNGSYATSYNGFHLFGAEIQTGAPVLFLIALLFKIFGISSEIALAVNAIYVIMLFSVIFAIMTKLEINNLIKMLTVLVILTNSVFWNYSMGIYGEIPMLAWGLLGLFLLFLSEDKVNKNTYFFGAGLCFGLTYLTKTVSLIFVPAIAIVIFYKVFIRKEITIKSIVLLISGFLLMILCFEVYKLLSMGSSDYIVWWSDQFDAILKQAGVKSGYATSNNNKWIIHLGILSKFFHINIFIIILIFLFNTGLFFYELKNRKFGYKHMIFLIAATYLIWWIFITPTSKAWDRRILVGMILFWIATMINLDFIIKKYLNKNYYGIYNCLTYAIIFFLFIILGKNISISKDSSYKNAVLNVSNEVKNIKAKDPNAIFCGINWWQAPVIAFYTDEKLMDFNKLNTIMGSEYIIVDQFTSTLGKEGIEDVLSKLKYETIYEDKNQEIYIYKVNQKLNYIPFSQEEKSMANKSYFKSWEDYEYINGMYDYETDIKVRWSQPYSNILLRNKKTYNTLNVICQIYSFEKLDNPNPVFKIFINDKEVCSKEITGNGMIIEKINLDNIIKAEEVLEIKLSLNSKLLVNSDPRSLSFIVNEIGLTD